MGTIFDYQDLDNTSLQSHPDQCYALVHDAFVNPDGTRRCSLDRLADFAPTKITPASPTTLAGTERYVILVDSQNVANTVTVPANQSCWIANVSTNGSSLTIIGTGVSNTTIIPGQTAIVSWDGAAHDVTASSVAPQTTVDSAMSDVSTNPVRNATIKAYVDNYTMVRKTDRVVIGSGSASTDASNLANAIDQLNDQYMDNSIAGTLWLDGEVKLNSAHVFQLPPRIRGLTQNAALRITDDAAQIACGPSGVYFDPIDSNGITGSPTACAISATSALAEQIVVTNPAYTFTANASTDFITATGHTFINGNQVILTTTGTLPGGLATATAYYVRDVSGNDFKLTATVGGAAVNITDTGSGTHTITGNLVLSPGDWVVVWSDDAITGVKPHITDGFNCPMELHQIMRVDSTNTYALCDFIVDALATNPRIRRVPMLSLPGASNTSDAHIMDLRIRQDASINNNRLFDLRCLNGITFSGCHWELSSAAGGPGHVLFGYCSNIRVVDCINDGMEEYNIGSRGYWWEFGVVMDALVQRINSRRCRHAVDTTSGSSNGTTRWGTARGLRCIDSIFHHEGHSSIGSLIAVSTHAEGWGVTYANCEFHLSAATYNGTALTARARRTIFRDNDVYGGGGGAKGCLINADDCEVFNNRFYGLWRAVVNDNSLGFEPSGTVISNNLIKDCKFAGQVHLVAGSRCRVTGNSFIDGAECAIEIEGPIDDVEIGFNSFDNASPGGTQGVIHATAKVSYTFTANASTNELTASGHTILLWNQVTLTTTGTLPAGLSPYVVYYAASVSGSLIKLATTFGGAAIDITDTGSGTHTIHKVNVISNLYIHHNDFRDNNEIGIDIGGSGDGHRITHNTFHDTGSGAALIKLAGGKNHRVAMNDMPNEINSNSINLGSLAGLTFTAATDDYITCAGHTLRDGDVVVVSSSGTLPTGLSANTLYYVRDLQADGTFKVSATDGGAAVDITATGSGTHTLTETCQVTIRGNVMDGYGAGSMGLTGTISSTVNTAQVGKNNVD